MSSSPQPPVDFRNVLRNLSVYRLRWIVPTVAITSVVLIYAVCRPATWEASQALLVRDEAVGDSNHPGRFSDADAMKTAQETILELAKSRSVLTAALTEVGPPAQYKKPALWPRPADVLSLHKAIKMSAPSGTEFGRTEVFYLRVEDHNRDRAVALTRAVCDRLETRLQELRDRKARGLIDELDKTMVLAAAGLKDATARLTKVERNVGHDLGELRILNESAGGESNLRRTMTEIDGEVRQARVTGETNRQLLKLLVAAKGDPAQLVAMPSGLLDAQPALKRLKDGLVDTQLRTSNLLGVMSSQHPNVQVALAAEEAVRADLYQELDVAIRGLKAELAVGAVRTKSLEKQLAEVNGRMSHLAAIRAEYGNLVIETRDRASILTVAQKELADARASQAAAHSASVITRLDGPYAGEYAVGPRRSLIVLAGLVGGLLTGLGIVFLTAAPIESEPQKESARAQQTHVVPARTGKRANGRPFRLSLKEALVEIAQSTPAWN